MAYVFSMECCKVKFILKKISAIKRYRLHIRQVCTRPHESSLIMYQQVIYQGFQAPSHGAFPYI